jgi:hypothetical protein
MPPLRGGLARRLAAGAGLAWAQVLLKPRAKASVYRPVCQQLHHHPQEKT